MADDQHPDTDAPEDSEDAQDSEQPTQHPAQPRGLGRFASRFRRDRRQPEVDASPAPADQPGEAVEDAEEASWLSPLDRTSSDRALVPGPEPLAPELDLTVTPPSNRAEAKPPSASPEPEPERAPEASAEAEPDAVTRSPRTLGPTAPTSRPALEPAGRAIGTTRVAPSDATPDPVLSAIEPEFDREDEEAPGPRTRPAGVSTHLVVLTAVATSIVMAFLLIEPSPRWLLLLGAAAVVFGLDGTLRQTWRAPFSLGQETAPFLFVPALYIMAVSVLIEHNVSGELVFLVGLGAGFGFGALAWAEIASVRAQAVEYDQARVIVTANTYLTGFAIFSLSYVFDISLLAAIVATSIAAAMLAVEVLREGEIDPMETLGLALVTGVVIGEARWLLYYIPLDTYLAGLTLLLVFYLATGLLHSHVIRALNRVVAIEYSGIAAAGLALVVLARAVGLA